MPKIPVLRTNSVFGHLRSYASDPLGFLQEKQKTSGDAFVFNVAGRKLNFINKPEYVQRVLQENHRNYKKSIAYQRLGLVLGQGLFTSEGNFWRRQRRLSQPLFHKAEIAEYEKIMAAATERMISGLKDAETLNINSAMTHLTLEIITETLLGLKLENGGEIIEKHLPPLLQKMIGRIVRPVNVPLWFPTRSNREFKQSVAVLEEMIQGLMKMKESEGFSKDLLSALMQVRDVDEQKMTHQQLQDELMTFFLAGHETTAVASTWAMYLIHTHPDIEKRLREELDDDDNTYLKALIQETLRFYSPVWALGRESIHPDQIGSFEITAGESIIFSPYMIHRHPDYWDEPERFSPERFRDFKASHKYAYFPFGGGPRLCIGNHFALMELEIILKKLLQNFQFKLRESSFPGFDYSLTLRPKENITFDIRPI